MMNVRYLVEHQGLPTLLYSEPSFPGFLAENTGAAMVTMYQTACGIAGQEVCPYRESDFRFDLHAMAGDPDDDRMFLIINMPEPAAPPECERVFVCLHRDSDAVGYYTVEKRFGTSVMCSWDQAGVHRNYGDAPETEEEQLQRVMELFR